MTLYEFSTLPENEKAKITWQGDFCTTREDSEHTILLYKVHDFFVEVYYQNRSNQIVRFTPLKPQNKLVPYLGVQLN